LKASIDVIRVFAFQGIVFRGQYESVNSTNGKFFLKILDLTISYNEQIAKVNTKTSKNAYYTSPLIQK
jgi:hypothetical protein